MCLSRRQLDPNRAAFTPPETFVSLPPSCSRSFVEASPIFTQPSSTACAFLMIGLAIGLLYWSARRRGGCGSRS